MADLCDGAPHPTAFWNPIPFTQRITKISRISSTELGQLILSKMVKIAATRYI